MSKIITFADAGVLIVAARGSHTKSLDALNLLGDSNREFCSTTILELEIRPKPICYGNSIEAQFYETYFQAVIHQVEVNQTLIENAFALASQYGLGAIDALHAVAAIEANADEFVTTEKPTKPLFRIKNLNVVAL